MPRMFDHKLGQAFLFLTDPVQKDSRTKLLRWLIFEEDGGPGLGVDTVYNMFFVKGDRLTDRAKSIDSPLFCDFVKMIKKRFPRKKVGYAFRKHWQEMDEYIENALAEEAAAAADEAFAKCSVDWPLDPRAMRVPDIYANYFALEGEFKRLRICIPSDQTRELN